MLKFKHWVKFDILRPTVVEAGIGAPIKKNYFMSNKINNWATNILKIVTNG